MRRTLEWASARMNAGAGILLNSDVEFHFCVGWAWGGKFFKNHEHLFEILKRMCYAVGTKVLTKVLLK